MFWKRKKEENETLIVVSQFGEFIWEHSHAWYCNYKYRNHDLCLSYIGNKFNISDLISLRKR